MSSEEIINVSSYIFEEDTRVRKEFDPITSLRNSKKLVGTIEGVKRSACAVCGAIVSTHGGIKIQFEEARLMKMRPNFH